ncbi:protein kinase [Planobispora siamensis]|uniref:Protein kinase domain-containing protein n=1 Tax=Planobispora siamensis TaxID=936338 RepID=A0A8J3SC33_9ACTN|nr:serine/threonine-protein kinase [Planobispora siamensis]GIH90465.1 hypothetical protein Psi01_10950 [Planobispora siamensis]
MPDVGPIGPGDPGRVAEYEIVGRLGEAVYLGRSPAGGRVVVRLLPADLDQERFLAAAGPLREISAFCTAEVLDTGVADGRPYIVSEYIDGPNLQEAVASGGTLRGAALHRLAVGMMTALVAVHQAGMIHGDIRPDNVVLGPDGPRVINFGVARALSATEAADTRRVGVPAFTAPEVLRGADPAPAADLFGWAATLAFAATGRSPFDGGSMAGTVNRILNDEPDLEAVEDDLRGTVAMCLAKDPDSRPAASDVLLRLVGELLTTDLGPAPAATRPVRRRRPLLLGAGAMAIALLSGGTVYLLTSPSAASAPVPVSAQPSPAGSLLPTAPTAAPPDTVLYPLEEVEKATKDVPIPGFGITVHENPKDPVRISSYIALGEVTSTHVREKGKDTFRTVTPGTYPELSPNEELAALNSVVKFTQSDTDHIQVTEVATGETFTVPTVKKPFETVRQPVWSADGSKVLLSVREADKKVMAGFVIVDVAARKATFVVTETIGDENNLFVFAPDGSIARRFFDGKTTGVDFYNLQGQIVRSMRWVGEPRGLDWFSPSGKLFYTICPKREGLCVWDTVTGNRRHTIPVPLNDGLTLHGWFNENHLMVERITGKNRQIQVIDFVGKVQRVLADRRGHKETAYLRFTRRSDS